MKGLLFVIFIASFSILKAGTAESISVYSPSMKKNIPCVVIKPSNYNKSSNRLNTVYLLHGYSGNQRQWLDIAPGLLALADTYNLFIICPDGGFSSWYFDSPIDPSFRYETFMSSELIKYIDTHYRTNTDKKSRAITGLSMGGHGSLFLASRHTDVYGAAGSTSGGVNMRPFPNQWDIKKRIGDTACCEETWKKYSVVNTIDRLKNNDLHIIIDCGTSDFFLNVNRELHRKLLTKKIDHDYIERPGGHNNDYWRNSINYQMLFFGIYFKAQGN